MEEFREKIAQLTELLQKPDRNRYIILRTFNDIFELSLRGHELPVSTLELLNKVAGLFICPQLSTVLSKLRLEGYRFLFASLNLISVEDVIANLSNVEIIKQFHSLPPEALNLLERELLQISTSSGHGHGASSSSSSGGARLKTTNSQRDPPHVSSTQEAASSSEAQFDVMHQLAKDQEQHHVSGSNLYHQEPYPPYQNESVHGWQGYDPGPGVPSYYGQVSQVLVPPYADSRSGPGGFPQFGAGWQFTSPIDMSGLQGYYPTGGHPSVEYSGGAIGRDSYRPEPRFEPSHQHLAQQQQHAAPFGYSQTQYPQGSAYGSAPIQQRSEMSIPPPPAWWSIPPPGCPPGEPNSSITTQHQMQFDINQDNGAVGGTEGTQQSHHGPNYKNNQKSKNSITGQKRRAKRYQEYLKKQESNPSSQNPPFGFTTAPYMSQDYLYPSGAMIQQYPAFPVPLPSTGSVNNGGARAKTFSNRASHPETFSVEHEVGEQILGAILEPGDETLREIQQSSGADITISQNGSYAPNTETDSEDQRKSKRHFKGRRSHPSDDS